MLRFLILIFLQQNCKLIKYKDRALMTDQNPSQQFEPINLSNSNKSINNNNINENNTDPSSTVQPIPPPHIHPQTPKSLFMLKIQSLQSIDNNSIPLLHSHSMPPPPQHYFTARNQTSPALSQSSPKLSHRQNTLLTELIRSKVSVYMTAKPLQGRLTPMLTSPSKQPKQKIFISNTDMPTIRNLQDLISKQKEIYHIYREKIDNHFQQCMLFYFQIVRCAVQYQYSIRCKEINKEDSVIVECLLFVVRSMIEAGAQKMAIFFSIKAIRLCEIFSKITQIGQFLYLMACATRKLNRFEHSIKLLKKSLQYIWRYRSTPTNESQLQIYNLLSQCLLQINAPEQSKIFGYKYELGYLQRQNSKIIQLSHQLIDSVQSRKSKWHAITKESMELLLEFDIQEFLRGSKSVLLRGRLQQKRVLQAMKVNFQYLYQNFLLDDMFFYQIPTPLEIVNQQRLVKKKAKQGTKFLIKKRSNSMGNLKSLQNVKLLKKQHEKPKQFMIFNYRGIGVSKMKLSNLFTDLVSYLKKKKQEQDETH